MMSERRVCRLRACPSDEAAAEGRRCQQCDNNTQLHTSVMAAHVYCYQSVCVETTTTQEQLNLGNPPSSLHMRPLEDVKSVRGDGGWDDVSCRPPSRRRPSRGP